MDEATLKALLVSDLRKMLKQRGLPFAGKKQDLVQRLLEDVQKSSAAEKEPEAKKPEAKKEAEVTVAKAPPKAQSKAKAPASTETKAATELARAVRLGLPVASSATVKTAATVPTTTTAAPAAAQKLAQRAERFGAPEVTLNKRLERFGGVSAPEEESPLSKRLNRFGQEAVEEAKVNTVAKKRKERPVAAQTAEQAGEDEQAKLKRQRIERFGRASEDPLHPQAIDARKQRFGEATIQEEKKVGSSHSGGLSNSSQALEKPKKAQVKTPAKKTTPKKDVVVLLDTRKRPPANGSKKRSDQVSSFALLQWEGADEPYLKGNKTTTAKGKPTVTLVLPSKPTNRRK